MYPCNTYARLQRDENENEPPPPIVIVTILTAAGGKLLQPPTEGYMMCSFSATHLVSLVWYASDSTFPS